MSFGAIIAILVVALVGYYLFKSAASNSTTKTQTPRSSASGGTTSNSPYSDIGWLMAYWMQADKEKSEGKIQSVPKWFFDEVTPRQLEKLAELGIKIGAGVPTKGKASDLIGLSNPVDDEDQEVLRFFKVPTKGMNQTKGRYEVRKLLSDSENLAKWDSRPASQEQKECYRFFGLKPPTGLTMQDAQKTIDETIAKARQETPKKADEWDSYSSLLDELADRDMLKDDFEMKKPSMTQIREAVAELTKDGQTWADIDAYDVAEKIKEKHPDMERSTS